MRRFRRRRFHRSRRGGMGGGLSLNGIIRSLTSSRGIVLAIIGGAAALFCLHKTWLFKTNPFDKA